MTAVLLDHNLTGDSVFLQGSLTKIGSRDKLEEIDYRDKCANRLVGIAIDLDRYLGYSRLFIP